MTISDAQYRAILLADDEATEREQRLYLAVATEAGLEIPDPDTWATSVDDARTELTKWEQECVDAGQADIVPTLRVVRGLTAPVELFCGSARRATCGLPAAQN